jgi:hypothetical protein
MSEYLGERRRVTLRVPVDLHAELVRLVDTMDRPDLNTLIVEAIKSYIDQTVIKDSE